MKEICKNCEHCRATYKSFYCDKDRKQKKVKLQGTCEDWREKRKWGL